MRLQRIKREAALIEEHSKKLESQKESVLKEESDISGAEPEVCAFIKIINIFLHSIKRLHVLSSHSHCPLASTTLPPSVQAVYLHSTTVTWLWFKKKKMLLDEEGGINVNKSSYHTFRLDAFPQSHLGNVVKWNLVFEGIFNSSSKYSPRDCFFFPAVPKASATGDQRRGRVQSPPPDCRGRSERHPGSCWGENQHCSSSTVVAIQTAGTAEHHRPH